MVDPFSVVGIVIILIVLLFAGKILTVLLKVLFWALLAAFAFVLIFDISWSDVLKWSMDIVLLTF
jgi:hypothetical protein